MKDTITGHLRVSTESSLPTKKCWGVGKNIVVAIDKEIVKRLEINEGDTYVQQEVTDDGILLRVKHYVIEGKT